MAGEFFVRVREGLRFRGSNPLHHLNKYGESGAKFYRVGSEVYFTGTEESLEGLIEDPILETVDDIIEFNNSPTSDVIEEVELHEFDGDEINLSEEAPLLEQFSDTLPLAEAGGVAGTSAGTASTSSVITGTAIVGGTVVIGTTLGVISAKKKSAPEEAHVDPVVSLPDHRYIGPGNTVDETAPVDTDDAIARDHDIAYENSKTQGDVQEADKRGADEFLADAIHNKNPHSAVGYIGLKLKEKAEGIIGVQYPPNLPTSPPAGMFSQSNAHHIDRRSPPKFPVNSDPRRSVNWRSRTSFKSKDAFNAWAKYTWSQWNNARQNRGLVRVFPPSRLGISVTQRPRTGRDNDAISFNRFKLSDEYVADINDSDVEMVTIAPQANPQMSIGEALSNSARRRQEMDNANLGHRVHNDPELNDIVESGILDTINQDVPMPDGGDISSSPDSEVAGPSGEAPPTTQDMTTRGQKRAHAGEQGGSAAPPQPTARSGTGHNSGSDGGFDSAQGPESFLPSGGYKASGGNMMFKKVHRMKSWAIPYVTNAKAGFRGGGNMVSTPLVKIPWEYAFMYLSPEEFALIPAGSYIQSVSMDVMQTVAQTGYPTGGTTASTATTNHPKVLCVGKDLEKKMRGGADMAMAYTADMIPTILGESNPINVYNDFIDKQYGTDQSSLDTAVIVPGVAHKIPFYNNLHFNIYQPTKAQALARGFFKEETSGTITDNVSPGFEYFSNCITEMNANDTTWSHVDSMSYNFTSAPIGEQYRHMEILTDDFNQSVGSAAFYNAQRNVTNAGPGENLTVAETLTNSSRNTIPVVTYKSAPMEMGAYMVKGDAANKPSRQPSYHIGMRAIDKSDPTTTGSRADKFVQANIEFEITCTMTIQLPSYPNRFVKPKAYNTTIENAVQGIGFYPNYGPDNFVTFGLYPNTGTAPQRAPVDQATASQATEDDMVVPLVRNVRPKRSLPKVPTVVKRKK